MNDSQVRSQGPPAPPRWLPAKAAAAILTLLGTLTVNAASPVVFVYSPALVAPLENSATNASVLISAPGVKLAQVARQLSLQATVAPAGIIQKVTFAPYTQTTDPVYGTNVYSTRMTVTPAANAIGSATITLTAVALGVTNTATIPVNVLPVNVAPSFALATNRIVVAQNSGPQKIAKALLNLSAGPTNAFEKTQIFDLTVTETEGAPGNVVMSSDPQIDVAGTLYFTLAPMSYGTNTVTVVMTDNGGTDNGGVDSFTNTFRIEVPRSGMAPVIDIVSLQSGSIPMYDTATATVYVYDVDSPWTSLSLSATSSKTNVTVSVGTATNPTNAWPAYIPRSYNLAAFPLTLTGVSAGAATITLRASDGQTSSATNTFTETVIGVVQPPSFTLSTNLVLTTENHAAVTVSNVLKNISAGPGQTNLNGSIAFTCSTPTTGLSSSNVLFSVQPSIDAKGTLTFTPSPNSFGTNPITVVMTNGGNLVPYGGISSFTNSFNIGVKPVAITTNVAGVLNIEASDVVVYEQSTAASVDISVYGVNSINPTNFTLNVSSSDQLIATVTKNAAITNDTPNPALGTNAAIFTLQLSPNPGIVIGTNTVFGTNGTTTITLTAGDGSTNVAGSFLFTVLPLNDSPHFLVSKAVVSVDENSGAISTNGILSAITPSVNGYSNENSQLLSFAFAMSPTYVIGGVTNTDLATLVIPDMAIDLSGKLTFTTPPDVYGTNQVTVVLTDNGGTTGGGISSYTNSFVLKIAQIQPRVDLSTNFVVVPENSGAITSNNFSTNILSALSPTWGTNYLSSARVLTASQTYYLTNWGDLNPKSDIALGITNLALSANGTLTFTTPPNVYGTNLVTVQLQVWNPTNSVTTNTYTTSFVLGILAQDTPPVFTLNSTNVTVSQYGTPLTLAHLIAGYSSAGAGAWESGQAVSFAASVSSGDSNYFTAAPSIVGSNLVFATKPSVAGRSVQVTITATDNGGANGISNSVQTVTLVFPPNAYTTAVGTYAGLYYSTPDLGPASVQSSGYINLDLNADGTFTGYLLNGTTKNFFTNAFNTVYADTPVTFKSSSPNTDYQLNLWMVDGVVTGSVANTRSFPGVWVTAYKTINAAAAKYNVVALSSSTNDPTAASAPVGDSIIGLTVSGGGGAVTLSPGTGLLADGCNITNLAAGKLCEDNIYPFYATPTNGTAVLFGWLQFVTNGTSVELTASSSLNWLVGANVTTNYATGFTNQLETVGSLYDPAQPLPFKYAWVVLGDMYTTGPTLSPIVELVSFNGSGVATLLTGSATALSLTITPATGLITGTFLNANGSAPATPIPFNGLYVPSAGQGAGFFLDGAFSGELTVFGIGIGE